MIDPAKLGRLRSLLSVGRNGFVSSDQERSVLFATADLLCDVAEVVFGQSPAVAPPAREPLPKKSPYKAFAEDSEWHKDRALTLLRHLANRPGSPEVRDAVEAFLRELGLEGKPVPPIGKLAATEAGPREVVLNHAEPLDVRSVECAVEGGILARSAGRAARKAIGLPAAAPAAAAPRAEAPPEHSRGAYDLGRMAGERGEGPEGNPFPAGSRGIPGSRRIWWERARSAAAWARAKRSGSTS